MSPFKFRTVLRLEKLSKTTNEAPVCLRITKDRKSTYKTLLHIPPSCWDAKGQCVIRHPNADLFNAVISRKRAEIEREACLLTLSSDEVSIAAIRNKINDHMSMDFLDYAYRYCTSLMTEKYGTYLRLRSVLNKLRGFVGAGGLPVRDITEDFIRRYEHYLSSEVGSSRNTIAMSMKFISKILGDIYRQYELDETANPFRKIKFHFEPSSRQYPSSRTVFEENITARCGISFEIAFVSLLSRVGEIGISTYQIGFKLISGAAYIIYFDIAFFVYSIITLFIRSKTNS